MMKEIIIIKCNHLGQETWRYSGKILREDSLGLIVEAFFNRSDLPFHGIVLRESDRFLELYPYGKWFNVYEVHDKDTDEVKAWYCNVTRPVKIDNGMLRYDDLALDLLVYPNGKHLALDLDEFRSLKLKNHEQKSALQALEELKSLFNNIQSLDIFSLIP